MNINENSTEDEILEYNDEELAYFQYVHTSKYATDLSLDDMKEKSRKELVQFCLQWIEKEKKQLQLDQEIQQILNDTDEDDVEIVGPEKVFLTQEAEEVIMTDKEENTDSDKSHDNLSMDTENPQDSIKLDNVKDIQSFKNLSDDQNHQWIKERYHSEGKTLNLETIQLWTNDHMNRTAHSILMSQNKVPTTKPSLKKTAKYSNKNTIQTDLQRNIMRPWRYSLFFTSPSDKKGTEGLVTYLSDIFHEMGSFCPGIQLLPWDSETFDDGVEDCEEIPKTITQLKSISKEPGLLPVVPLNNILRSGWVTLCKLTVRHLKQT